MILRENRAELARRNAENLGERQGISFLFRDATRLDEKPAELPVSDLVFLDPPYHNNLIAPALKSLREGGWLSQQALLIAETSKGEIFEADGFERLDTRAYGETEIAFLTPTE